MGRRPPNPVSNVVPSSTSTAKTRYFASFKGEKLETEKMGTPRTGGNARNSRSVDADPDVPTRSIATIEHAVKARSNRNQLYHRRNHHRCSQSSHLAKVPPPDNRINAILDDRRANVASRHPALEKSVNASFPSPHLCHKLWRQLFQDRLECSMNYRERRPTDQPAVRTDGLAGAVCCRSRSLGRPPAARTINRIGFVWKPLLRAAHCRITRSSIHPTACVPALASSIRTCANIRCQWRWKVAPLDLQ